MKCKHTTELEDKYFDESLYEAMKSESGILAPEGFTLSVMDKVMEISAKNPYLGRRTEKVDYSPIFRRLGVSMIATAAIMLIYTYIPGTYANSVQNQYREEKAPIAANADITNSLGRLDSKMKNIFKVIGSSIGKNSGRY